MAQVQHKDLTGTSLHEPKGVASAAANTLYAANGLGTGAWGKITASMLDATVSAALNPFGGQLLVVRDVKATTTGGGAFASGAWQTRTINTVSVNQITGASLAANQITLPAGSYIIMAFPFADNCALHQSRLQNITDATTTQTGLNAETGGGGGSISPILGSFTIAAQKTFEIQHRCSSAGSYGDPNSFGLSEIYLTALIWKIA